MLFDRRAIGPHLSVESRILRHYDKVVDGIQTKADRIEGLVYF